MNARALLVLLVVVPLCYATPGHYEALQSNVALTEGPGGSVLEPWIRFLDRSARVVAEQDIVLRNYQITQSYYDLSVLLHGILNRGQSGWY